MTAAPVVAVPCPSRRPFSRSSGYHQTRPKRPVRRARELTQAGAVVSMDERNLTRPRHRKHSAVTSGRKLLIDGNPNSAWARRYRDLVAGHAADLGGRSELSEGELSLIRRASALECELEAMEAAMSRGDE